MKRVLFVWELGANLGHLARDLPVAQRLRELGCKVTFAVRDLRIAQQVLASRNFQFFQAPRLSTSSDRGRPPVNYSGVLLASGYDDEVSLAGGLSGWMTLLEALQPNVVVINHAPTAVLAARVLSIPAVMTCIGFELPPSVDPLPSIRPWDRSSISELREIDATVLRNVNTVLRQYSKSPLHRVADLFSGLPAVLTTFPELDHYGDRPNARYVGPLSALPATAEGEWPSGEGKRVFAYLRPSVPGFEHLITALQESGASVLCVAPGVSEEAVRHVSSPRFKLLTHPVSLDKGLRQADLAVVYGSGTMSDALLAGVPLLMVPQVVEQLLVTRRIEELGAGLLWRAPRTIDSARAIVRKALDNPDLLTAARAFALRYQGFSPEAAANSVIEVIYGAIARS
ncbi:UDP-glucuronosyltransferase [Ralstonia sp. TCR112]|uniref:glycosyltransferase n=1 Tax=Ralstonia sp. TCR112 TaxID=2601730 RepID=UPI0011BDC0A9|nr:UDP-glucuronosyltransferase [Ralstonia sp. TCR112]TXD63279.1 UDP-glucuronosyltransferase [Ralstonia sp. TCR112]